MVDTFPAFLKFWKKAQKAALVIQIERWATEYMAEWPELLGKQLADYASRQEDWKKTASEKIFPHIIQVNQGCLTRFYQIMGVLASRCKAISVNLNSSRLPAMEVAYRNIVLLYPFLCNQACQKFGLEINATCVLYVGIGCGAGWVTTYQDKPAILFGLENIAESGWSDSNSISGLIAHELGHVIQNTLRKQASLRDGDGAWWQLFSEGYAQRCEHLILGQNTWHEGGGSDQNWISWCQAKKAYLASEFLRFVAEGKDMRPFFGSWYHIDGHSQCGYFLGHEAVRELEMSDMSIREIGMLEKPEKQLRETLEFFANNECT